MANGGITIATISDIKTNWDSFLKEYKKLLQECDDTPIVCRCKTGLQKIEDLPNTVYEYEIIKLIKSVHKECETPYLFDKFVIVGWGDTNSCTINNLSQALTNTCKGVDVETWT